MHQVLAVAPALDIASNLFLGREIRRKGPLGSVLRMLDTGEMRRQSAEQIKKLGIGTLQNIGQAVETLSGGQRQAVAVARASAFGSHVVILDEPTAALGVRETGQVLKLIRDLRDTGQAVILISHDMPNVFELADRIHIQRLGARRRRDHAQDAHDGRRGRDHDRRQAGDARVRETGGGPVEARSRSDESNSLFRTRAAYPPPQTASRAGGCRNGPPVTGPLPRPPASPGGVTEVIRLIAAAPPAA